MAINPAKVSNAPKKANLSKLWVNQNKIQYLGEFLNFLLTLMAKINQEVAVAYFSDSLIFLASQIRDALKRFSRDYLDPPPVAQNRGSCGHFRC